MTPAVIICADWGKEPAKRAVYVADVAERVVSRISSRHWSFRKVVDLARQWEHLGPVLVAFDAPLGVPESYLAALASNPLWIDPSTFIDFLPQACAKPNYFDSTLVPENWNIQRPFFAVPAVAEGLKSYERAARLNDVDLYRSIDRLTGAKTVFAKSGIPGSVGSAACALWAELAAELTEDRAFRVWPFEGALDELLTAVPIVVGEIYPRAAYATALLDEPHEDRPRLALSKTKAEVRRAAVFALLNATWVGRHDVSFQDLAQAETNEDDFDACLTAAALLRCVLEQMPLAAPLPDARSEGGILGTGTVNLALRERSWGTGPVAIEIDAPRRRVSNFIGTGQLRSYRCPIPGCAKVFVNSRGGWDGHVGSIRLHPHWHSETQLPEIRRHLFTIEFPQFFE